MQIISATEVRASATADSVAYYKDSIQWSLNNRIKAGFVERAMAYSLREKDTLALYTFKLEHNYLVFSQGKYLEAFDSLLVLEAAVAEHLGRPSLWQESRTPFIIRNRQDSLWADLHVGVGIALAEVEIYLSEYTEATNLITTVRAVYSRDSTDLTAGRCYNAMGAIFAHRGSSENAKEYFYRALGIVERYMAKDKVATIYSNLVSVHLVLNEPDLALKCALESYTILKQLGFYGEKYIYSIFYLGISYWGIGQYDLAEEYLNMALEEAEKQQYGHLVLYIRGNLVRLYVETGRYDLAEKHARINLEEARIAGNKFSEESSLQYLARVYEFKGDYRQGMDYLFQAYQISKDMAESDRNVRMNLLQRRFENYKQEQEYIRSVQALELANASLHNRNLWICVFFFIGLGLVGGLFVVYRRLRVQRRINRIMRMHIDETESQSNDRLELWQTNMQRALTDKDKELTSMALYYVKIQGLVEALGEKLRAMRIMFGLRAKEKMYVSEMESLLKAFTPDKNWNEFELYFKQVDVGFFEKLEQRFPDLTHNEKRLCALLRLNLNAKEIASMTSRTFRSVNTAKTRLKKKLGCDKDQSLYDFLSQL